MRQKDERSAADIVVVWPHNGGGNEFCGDLLYHHYFISRACPSLLPYQDEAAKVPNLVVGGRLGGYKYYDMDQAMAAALELPICEASC